MIRALLAFAFVPAMLLAQAPCAGTPAYSTCEFVFELSEQEAAAHPNPYADVRLHAEFRSPRFRTLLMPAFWDGGRRMVIRFAPTEPGEWVYRITSNLASLEGKTGTFTAAASEAPGFISPRNVHHWSWTEGNRPHLWMGDTCDAFLSLDDAAFRAIVDARAQQKFNHLRGTVLTAETAPKAFPGSDRPDPAFFRRMDERVAYMNSKGMVADLVLAGGGGLLAAKFPEWRERESMVRYLIARYAPFNITWQGVRDFESYPDGRALLKEIGTLLKQQDPYRHPSSSDASATSGPLVGDGWMDHVVERGPDSNVNAIEHQLYAVPFVNAGFGCEDSGAGKSGSGDMDSDAFRRRLWNATMDGQGVTFCNTGTSGGGRPADAKFADSPGARAMTAWNDFFLGTRYWELEPYFDVDGGRALALEGVEYIVYVEKPGPVELLVEKHGYDVAWVNPITGERTREKGFKGEHFTAEPPNRTQDWVLHVSREGRKEGMRSYKFESRRIMLQEIEQAIAKVPFEIEQPAQDALPVGQPVAFSAKIKRETRATRSMMWLWTGESTPGGQGYRVIGTGGKGSLTVPDGLAKQYPAPLLLRLYGMNANGKVYSLDRPYQITK